MSLSLVDTWTVLRDVTVTDGHVDSIERCDCHWWTGGRMYRMDRCDCHLWIHGLYEEMLLLLVDTWTVWIDVTVTGGHY